jgi:hypothetical protein
VRTRQEEIERRTDEGAFCYAGGVIYLFYGSDSEKVRTKAFEWIAAARTKQPEVAYVRLAREEITSAALEDVTLSGGLFVKRLLVLLDVEKEGEGEAEKTLDEYLDQLAASDNAIIILAPKMLASRTKKIAAKAVKTYLFEAKEKGESARGFNVGLVNALASRNKERLWLEVVRALRLGDAPEMLHGLLHWKARSTENRELSLRLISLLQDSRRKGLDLSSELERFALSI